MGRTKYILIFCFLTISTIFSTDKFQWQKIVTGINAQLTYVSGNSKDDFWVQNSSGKLLHIKNGTITTYAPPSSIKFIGALFYKISKGDFFCSVITQNWGGEIYRIKNNVWEKCDINITSPIRYFYKTNNGLYLIGDSGLLLTFKNDRWEVISTPFENHITKAVVSSNKLYLITRNDGIILFENNKFTFLTKKENYKTTKNFKIIDSTLYSLSINNKIIKYSDTTETEIESDEILKYFISQPNSKFGFAERNITYNKKKIKIVFPQDYNILAISYGIENIEVLKDNTILLFSNDGNIFISKPTSQNFFSNLAQLYRIDDLPNSDNTGVCFFDANNDGINDLLILNRSYGNYLSFYRGVKNSPFANITSISNLPGKDNQILHFAISDFNKDNLKDLIFEMRESSKHKLVIYQNDGNFRFKKIHEIILPNDFQIMGIRNLSSYDYDRDGDEDIIVTSYYGKGNTPGYVLIYKNNHWGNFNEVDTCLKSLTRHWNEKIIFADIDNNDTLDIFNCVSWHKNHLLFGTDSGFVDKSYSHLPNHKSTGTADGLLSDYDNDGDLDIFTVGRNNFIRIYLNNGEGKFTEVTSQLFANNYLINSKFKNSANLNLGDFNNDGYTDFLTSLYFSDTSYTALFISDSAKYFVETPLNIDNEGFVFKKTTISDFDNDGDLDIYGATKKHNLFLINRLDNNEFIKLKLRGIISAPQALGSKVWIYKSGKLNSASSLIAYKELGTDAIGKNKVNDLTLHFGLGNNKKCDIKVKFLSGKEIILKNVSAGSFLTVNEIPAFYALFYNLPGNIYRFLIKTNNQIYILLILVSHLILILGLWYGNTKFRWNLKLTFIFTILNISLFWISLYIASLSNNNYIKFLTPLALTILVTLIPLALFYWFNKTTRKNYYAYNDKLLELVMAFSHGEWALRNLNSIILLCENSPQNWKENNEFNSKLKTRLNTFSEMTIASLTEIINYEKLLGNSSEELHTLETTATETTIIIDNINNNIVEPDLKQLTENLTSIRHNIKELRNIIYSRFSSKPTEVINNLIENMENVLTENSVSIEKKKLYPQEIPVLIRNYELGSILDNLLQNSIRFMKNSEAKTISIELYKESPKIILKFSNTGIPLPEDKWEIIFKQGYSESNSTGQGLFSAREILKKYGGRIYVSESNHTITTFRIELNEGIILN